MAKEFDEVDLDNMEADPESRFMRWMSVLVLVLAVAGFFALAWYAYNSGTSATHTAIDESGVEVVKADSQPIKEIPQERGGQQFPHQDKTVFNAISGGEEKPRVEQILPPSEEPVDRETSASTQVWMNEDLYKKAHPNVTDGSAAFVPSESPASAPPATDVATVTRVPAVPFNPDSVTKTDTKPATEEKPVTQPEPPVETKKSEAPPAVKEQAPPVVQKQPESAAPKETSTTTPKSGNIRVQLGAYKSQEEADSNWNTIRRKFAAEFSGKEHRIFRVDLGAKGIFYRLQVSPFAATSEAQSFCRSLSSRGQGCFLVTR